jgi:hypothetical protein
LHQDGVDLRAGIQVGDVLQQISLGDRIGQMVSPPVMVGTRITVITGDQGPAR